MAWFRWWHDSIIDPKFRMIAHEAKLPTGNVISIWLSVLEHAAQRALPGSIECIKPLVLSIVLDYDQEAIEKVLKLFEAHGLVKNGHITNWDKRQVKREDNSYERVKRFRDKKKMDDVTQVKRNVTHDNAPEQSRTDTDTEQIQSRAATESNENYLLLLEKYFPSISMTNIKVFRMFVAWKEAKVIDEDIENAIAYAQETGAAVRSPVYFQQAVIDRAMSRAAVSSTGSKPNVWKTKEQLREEHNERVKREFLESENDEN